MDYFKMKDLFETSKGMKEEDLAILLQHSESQEEKEFYLAVFHYFLRKEQEHIVGRRLGE